MKIEIHNGRLIDPAHGIDRKASLYIAAGKVASIDEPPSGWHPNRVIDASKLVVCPGLIDASARLREPGFEYKATLESEMQAAVAGGVTSLACPPDTDPPLDEPGLVEMLKHRARSLNQAHVYPVGALTVALKGEAITEMGELTEAGCIAFSHADAALADTQILLRALQYAATFGYRVWLRPQEAHLARGGVAHDGEVATRLGLAAIPSCAETIALDAIFELVRATGSAFISRGSPRTRVSRACAPQKRRDCPSPATSPCTTSTCARWTSAGSIRTAAWCRRCVRRATARRCAQVLPMARSISSARIMRRSTTTASSFPSPKPSQARRDSSCCCR